MSHAVSIMISPFLWAYLTAFGPPLLSVVLVFVFLRFLE